MKESISYSFLLNIVLLFIFVGFAIIMGSLSYYKAFKANSIISSTIEKYEGYNCVSAEEIARKLQTIGYNTPFNTSCNGKGRYCMTDTDQNYIILSYNLDFDGNMAYEKDDEKTNNRYKRMNSTYVCDNNGCKTNKHYQYGIYTYMYVELPIVSNLIRIPFFAKTSIMYEHRNFYAETFAGTDNQNTIGLIDASSSFDELFSKTEIDGEIYVKDEFINKCVLVNGEIPDSETGDYDCTSATAIQRIMDLSLELYMNNSTTSSLLSKNEIYQIFSMAITGSPQLNYRTRAIIKNLARTGSNGNELFDSSIYSSIGSGQALHECGFIRNYGDLN